MRIDIDCPDLEAAARNRDMVKHKQNIQGYLEIEAIVKNWPRTKPLPFWITPGNLPQVGKQDTRELYQHGMHIVDN